MKALKNHPLTDSLPGCGNAPKRLFSLYKSTRSAICFATLLFAGLLTPKQGFGQLKGTYTIDPGKSASTSNYKDFHSAICDLDSGKRYDGGTANGKGVNGAVVFEVANGTYNEQNTLIAIKGSSLSNTVTFTSASGDSSKAIVETSFSSSNPEYILTVSGASNIIINDLTFNMSGIGSNSASPGSYAGIFLSGAVNNLSVTHCAFLNNSTFGPYGIYSVENAASSDSNKVFTNNLFNSTIKAIYMMFSGNNSTPNEKYTDIENNTVINTSSGFYLYSQDHFTINNNSIGGGGGSAPTQGIYISGCTNLNSLSLNNIYAGEAIAIINTNCSSAHHGLISNNIINSFNTGINISGTSYCDIYYNNIYTQYSFSAPLCLYISQSSSINIENNSMETDPAATRNCIQIDKKTDISACDYNNYYSADSLGRINNSPETTLSAWQSASGFDKHSLNINPNFHLTNALKSDNPLLLGKATPLSSVSVDFLGKQRSKTAPTIGAYELINAKPGLSGTYTINPNLPASATNYKDLNSAFSDLSSGDRFDGFAANGKGVVGPVILQMADSIYNYGGTPTNPATIALSTVPGSSSTNTITLTSVSSDSSKVMFSNVIFGLNNVHNVVISKIGFDLKYTGGSTSFFITGGSNITITHCLFQTIRQNSGIIKYDTDTTDSVFISHNNFQGSGESMLLNEVKDLVVTDNIVSNASVSSGLPNGHLMFFSGFGDRNLLINNNTFLRTVDTGFSIDSKGYYISNNRILAHTGLVVGGEDSTADTIVNNTIITHKYGIVDGAYYEYENLAILDNNIYTDSVGESGIGACIYVDNSYEPFNSIIDNNIENGPGRSGIYFTSTKMRGTIDYNNYYYTDSFGYFGKKYADFKSFQIATGFEKHGLNIDPHYDLSNSLKTGNQALANKGTAISTIRYDISGLVRNSISPTIGAYEIQNVTDSITTCKNSCLGMKAPVSGRKYLWSTGDTTQVITYCPTKNSLVTVKVWTGTSSKDTTNYTYKNYLTLNTCVWPGDANNDGKADINDMLNIGVAYGDLGSARPNATTAWTGQPCKDWISSFQNGTNHKAADCNGDGIVDSTDLKPIALNFSKTHAKVANALKGNPTDPPLSVLFSQDSVQAGDSVTAIISLGSSAIKAYNEYGLTVGISYGNYMLDPKSITADFSKSWLGTIHKNMIDLVVNDTADKIIYIGISRTDHNSVSGAGEVGALSIYMPDNVAGKREVKQIFDLAIVEYKSISANEGNISLNPVSDSILVYQYKSGINPVYLNNAKITVYPNPAQNNIYVNTENELITGITITDMMGKTISQLTNEGSVEMNIPVSALHSGIYFMDIRTQSGTYRTRFIKE